MITGDCECDFMEPANVTGRRPPGDDSECDCVGPRSTHPNRITREIPPVGDAGSFLASVATSEGASALQAASSDGTLPGLTSRWIVPVGTGPEEEEPCKDEYYYDSTISFFWFGPKSGDPEEVIVDPEAFKDTADTKHKYTRKDLTKDARKEFKSDDLTVVLACLITVVSTTEHADDDCKTVKQQDFFYVFFDGTKDPSEGKKGRLTEYWEWHRAMQKALKSLRRFAKDMVEESREENAPEGKNHTVVETNDNLVAAYMGHALEAKWTPWKALSNLNFVSICWACYGGDTATDTNEFTRMASRRMADTSWHTAVDQTLIYGYGIKVLSKASTEGAKAALKAWNKLASTNRDEPRLRAPTGSR